MFAESLKKLQKRTSQLTSQLSSTFNDSTQEEKDAKREDSFPDDPLGGSPPDAEALRSALGGLGGGADIDRCVLVRYALQVADVSPELRRDGMRPDADRDGLSAFVLPANSGGQLTGGILRAHFPLPGRFHFRIRQPTVDQAFGGYVWVDVSNDEDIIPVYGSEVCMKALKVPDKAAKRVLEPVALPAHLLGGAASSGSAPIGSSRVVSRETGYTTAAPPVANRAEPSSPTRRIEASFVDGLPEDAFREPQGRSPPPPAKATDRAASPPAAAPPVAPALPVDLMELDRPAPAKPAAASVPVPSAPLDRNALVAQREAEKQERIDSVFQAHATRKAEEDTKRDEKTKAMNKLSTEMDRWAKTPDGQTWKEIRSLLGTLQDVLWPNSNWTPMPLSDLLADANIKKGYRKAIIICHPDRHQDAEGEQQYRAERIFEALNAAFKASQNSS